MLTTFGSLGDLYPYLAVALGLQARGHDAVIATGECYRQKVEALGLGFRPVRPDSDWVSDPDVMRRMSHPRWGLIRVLRELVLPTLQESFEDTQAALDGADLLVANQAAYSGRIAAEKHGIPWVSVMHIPLVLYSSYDPPILPGFPGVSKQLHRLGPCFWKPMASLIRSATRLLAKPLDRLRAEIGLPPAPEKNSLLDGHSPALHLALFSKRLADKQRDWPPQTVVTGFPWFDQVARLPDSLTNFLDAGPSPIVFTLGTAVSADAGEFYERSAAAARLLGRRAILIHHDPRQRLASLPDGVAAFDYAPFSALFSRAAAIVHHGGIGTTALAMRSGRPMLIMPCAWDQPDNAERAARLGIARIIPRHRYTPARIAAELRSLLDTPAYSHNASQIAEQVQHEDGVRVACDALEALL
ncbi:MAG: glycosyltransferase [Planctomycetaceae bacterium]|nr:glycosyltransferase [Planctomycetaceae bacterium]